MRQSFNLPLQAYKHKSLSYFAPPRPSPSSSLLPSSTEEGEVFGLTPSNWGHGASEVPSTYARPSFRQLPWGRGLGSVRSFSGTKTSLTILLVLHCLGEGFFWPSLSLTELRQGMNDLQWPSSTEASSCFLRLIRRTKAGSTTT